MEILSVTDDPTFDDEVKAEEELAAKEGKNEHEDEEDEKEDVKRKSRLNVKSMEESGSDTSCSDEDITDDDDDDDDEKFEDEDGEKKRKKTPKKKKKKKDSKKEKGAKDSKGSGVGDSGDHDSKVKNMRSELRTNALQTGLLAYLRAQGQSGDPTYSHAQRFYLAQWFKDAQDEAKVALANKNKSAKKVSWSIFSGC